VIGFCLAAGAGTRLRPLTRTIPKPLLAPAGRPLVDLAIEALQAAGATRVVVNAHHGADQLVAHLTGRAGVEVLVEPELLGTGGGLVNAARLGLLGTGDDPVLVTAADHVVDPADLATLAAFLDRSGAPMAAGLVPATTQAFRLRLEGHAAAEPTLWTATDPPLSGRLRSPSGGPGTGGWGSGVPFAVRGRGAGGRGSPLPWAAEDDGGRVVPDPDGPWDSAGAYAIRAGVLCDLEPGYATLVGRVLGPLLDRGRVAGLPFRGAMVDAGTLARLLEVSAGLLAGRWPYALPAGRLVAGPVDGTGQPTSAGAGGPAGPGRGSALLQGPVLVAARAEVDPAAVVAGPVVLDAGCRVGPGAVVTRSVVGPQAVIGAGAQVIGSFLGPRAQVPSGAPVVAALLPPAGSPSA
jgi:NDP-sugar pyrophosphorylase family protein